MASAPAQVCPSAARQPASGHDLGGATRPNLDFGDNGWGPFLRLTPGSKEEQERVAPHTCAYIADNAASPVMKCACESRARASATTKDEVAAKEDQGQKFFLPVTPLRLAPVVREAHRDTEKNAEKGEEPAFQAPTIADP
ncbi:hypothetical protein DPSP01_007713 [Paraphaeosphaeria sporulosa]